jgi:hypothetical protein
MSLFQRSSVATITSSLSRMVTQLEDRHLCSDHLHASVAGDVLPRDQSFQDYHSC